ncbi:mucin TcMUCII [Trypanosoma cruzi cruzi]|uniref:Putative mucin TcMUCII n=1 Tax=Trypanosoma cruzi TaxID=5693 RepID=A0A2V2W018_TRYCR|nr:mucin TcMUCII [Trypanosoma cruzi cruzi]PWV01063.1 putative mucin TcMUCII [Trypanosoma cruzi]
MMMTCRLLCALLVLALCCCPSVCTSNSPENVDDSSKATNGTTQAPTTNKPGGADGSVNSHSTSSESGVKEKDQLGLSGSGSGLDKGKNLPGKPGTTGPEPQPDDAPDTVQGEDKSMTMRSGGSRPTADQPNEKAKDHAETTTTTTTTQAPSTTTIEAPTTTTTLAPSRLREVDGSLSSSAWVCAPPLLAASALAYTAVG